jgi:hypothetical protein
MAAIANAPAMLGPNTAHPASAHQAKLELRVFAGIIAASRFPIVAGYNPLDTSHGGGYMLCAVLVQTAANVTNSIINWRGDAAQLN